MSVTVKDASSAAYAGAMARSSRAAIRIAMIFLRFMWFFSFPIWLNRAGARKSLPRIEERCRFRAWQSDGSLNPRSVHVQTGLPAWLPSTGAPSHSRRNSGSSLFRPPYGYWDSPGFAPGSLGPGPLLIADQNTLFNWLQYIPVPLFRQDAPCPSGQAVVC